MRVRRALHHRQSCRRKTAILPASTWNGWRQCQNRPEPRVLSVALLRPNGIRRFGDSICEKQKFVSRFEGYDRIHIFRVGHHAQNQSTFCEDRNLAYGAPQQRETVSRVAVGESPGLGTMQQRKVTNFPGAKLLHNTRLRRSQISEGRALSVAKARTAAWILPSPNSLLEAYVLRLQCRHVPRKCSSRSR